MSITGHTVSITLERNLLECRNTNHLLNHGRFDIIKTTHIISDECIENGQNLIAVVTLSKQRKCNRLGHFVLLSVYNCVLSECLYRGASHSPLYTLLCDQWCIITPELRSVIVAIELTHLIINIDHHWFVILSGTIDSSTTLLCDLIQSITGRRNVTHDC